MRYKTQASFPFSITYGEFKKDVNVFISYNRARVFQLTYLINYMNRARVTQTNIYKNLVIVETVYLELCEKELEEIYEEHPEYLV